MGGKAIGMPFGQRFGTQPPPSAFTIQCAFQCCELEAASSLGSAWRPVKDKVSSSGRRMRRIVEQDIVEVEHIDIPISYAIRGSQHANVHHMPLACRCVAQSSHPTLYTRVSQHPSPNGPCLSTAWGVCTAATCTVDMTVAAGDDTAPLAAEGAPTFASVHLISAPQPHAPPNAPRHHHPAPRERRPGRPS